MRGRALGRGGEANQRHPRRALSEKEIERFLAAASEDDRVEAERMAAVTTIENGTKGQPYSSRPRRTRVPQLPLFTGLIETGARWGELTRTAWGDFDGANRTLRLRSETTKSRKERMLPLRDSFTAMLEELGGVHELVLERPLHAADPIFRTPEGLPWPRTTSNALRLLQRILAAAKIPRVDQLGRKVDLHALRHTTGSRLARASVPLVQAQRFLDHSTPELTARIYTHVETEDLRDAIRRLPGGGGPSLRRIPGANLAPKVTPYSRCARKSLAETGAGDGDRTHDIQLGKLTFYR